MRTIVSRTVSAAALTFSLAVAAPGAEIPALKVPICRAAPRMDGALDDPAWRDAARVDSFVRIAGEPGPARGHQAWVTRDAAWLYAAFAVDQPEAQRDPPLYGGHDQPIQREDNVQVSFEPGTDGALFYQFLVNKGNARADFRMTKTKGRECDQWTIPWKSAVAADPKGWTVELALPLVLLTEHGDPAKARLNLIVDTFRVERDAMRVKTGARREYWSWAPLAGTSPANAWVEPERFGHLQGLAADAIVAPLLPALAAPAVSPFYRTNATIFYDVLADLTLSSSATGTVTLEVIDQPSSGGTNRLEHRLAVPGTAMRMPVRVPVPAAAMTAREVRLRLLDGATGELWQDVEIADVAALNLLSAELDRDYYTTEPEANARCRVRLPKQELRGLRLVARQDGRDLVALTNPPPDARLGIPLGDLAAGAQTLRVDLAASDGALLASAALPLVKRAPRPGCEWKVDRDRGCLLDNGKPFFPVGMVMGGVKPTDEYDFAKAADAGFNTLVQWTYRPDGDRSDPAGAHVADIRAYLDQAARHGLKVIAAPDMNYVPFNDRTRVRDRAGRLTPAELEAVNRVLNSETCSLGLSVKDVILSAIPARDAATKTAILMEYLDNQMPYLTPVIKAAMTHPALAGIFIFDEPLNNIAFGQIPVGREYYRRLKALDGYHPVFVNWNPGIYQFPDDWFDWMDMLGIDPYWTPEYAGSSGTIDYVGWMAHHVARKAERLRVVPVTVLMGSEYNGILKRALLPVEQIGQTYLALIHGVKGIVYFPYPERSQISWDTLCELARRMRRLGPVCLAPALPQTVAYSGGPYDLDARKMPDIQVALKRDPEGGYVLLAASVAYRPVAAAFATPLLDGGGTVAELFAGTAYEVKAGGFQDTFEPLGARAYRIRPAAAPEPGADATPIRLAVTMTPRGPVPPRAVSYGRTGRTDHKNLVPNPSFEEQTVPTRPDYWRQTGTFRAREMTGATNQVWGLSTHDPYHGARCLEMISTNGDWRFAYLSLTIERPTPEPYVLSAWLRSDRDGQEVRLRAGKSGDIPFKVTRAWQRFSVPFEAGAGQLMLGIHFRTESRTTVWADAVQVERGQTPTEFDP